MVYTIISNPGSNSKKYSLYEDKNVVFSAYLDPNCGHPQCLLKEGNHPEKAFSIPSAEDGAGFLKSLLSEKGISLKEIDAIMLRVVATGKYFSEDHIIDEEYIENLNALIDEQRPLHASIVMKEILALRKAFGDTKIISVSDSSFHSHRPDVSMYYAVSPTLSDICDLKRYGAHGLSMESIRHKIWNIKGALPGKIIACHIGSGVSVTAIRNGNSVETTMGFTPLEGVSMGTRCGNIDTAATMRLKNFSGYSDQELIDFLNLECGLKGLGGSGDFRDIDKMKDIKMTTDGKRPKLAYDMFVNRIVMAIGGMAAIMNGVDAIVFAGTISERNPEIREKIVSHLGYLDFHVDKDKNVILSQDLYDISASSRSKPILVVKIDEAEAMLGHKEALIG